MSQQREGYYDYMLRRSREEDSRTNNTGNAKRNSCFTDECKKII